MFSFLRSYSHLHQANFWSYLTSSRYKTVFDLNEDLAKVEETPLPEIGAEDEVVNGRTIGNWIAIAERVSEAAKKIKLSGPEKAEHALLEQQLVALKTRAGLKVPPVAQEVAERFRSIILKYCHQPKIHPHAKADKLSELSEARWKGKIDHTLATQPLFVQAIVERHGTNGAIECRDDWTANYVKWTLRSGASDAVCIEAPNEAALIRSAHLDKRSGAVSKDKGFIFDTVDGKRTLCMRIDGAYVPIQGKAYKERKISLSYWNPTTRTWQKQAQNPYTLKIRDIFSQFKKKTFGYEEVEWIEGRGVVLWNTIHLGSFDTATKKHLSITTIDDLPLFKTTTAAELSERYGREITLTEGQWAVGFCVTRLTPDDNISDCHAYLEVVRPKRDSPTEFEIIPIGHQPYHFPQGPLEKLFSLGATLRSGMHIFDESYYFSHRQRTGEWFVFDKGAEKIDWLKTELTQSIMQGKGRAMVFQPTGKNCAFWVQNIYRRVILRPFSEELKQLAQRLLPNRRSEEIERVFFDLSDDTLNAFVNDLIEAADQEAIQHLYKLLREYVALLDPGAPTNVPLNFTENYAQKTLKDYLSQALKIALRTQKLFKQDPSDADYSNFLRCYARFLQWFSSTYIRNKLMSLLLFLCLGSWRWVSVRNVDANGNVLSSSHCESRCSKPDHYLYLPAALFKWQKRKDKQILAMRKLFGMMGAAAQRQELPSQSKKRFSIDELLSKENFEPLVKQTQPAVDMLKRLLNLSH